MPLVDRPADAHLSRRRRAYLRRLGVRESVDEVHFARTGDGWEIALSRRRPRGRRRRRPVVLCHGLGANRFTWDLDPERSLFRHLADQGFDVFCVELRGHGRSQRVGPGGARWGWSLWDYADRDLPAAFDAVLELTGADALQLVGHSMGGILLHIRRARGDERLAAGIAVGAAVDYSGTPSVFHDAARLVGLTRVLPAVPLGPLTRFLAPVALAIDNPIDRANVHPSNVERPLYRRLCAVGFHAVSAPVLRTLAPAMAPGGLRLPDGTPVASFRGGRTPLLALAGTADLQCHPDAAGRGCQALRAFGRAHGQADDYGHFDLVMGRRAEAEVWPVLAQWLIDHDALP